MLQRKSGFQGKSTIHKTEMIWNDFSYKLKSFILNRVSNSTHAEDILQDVFVKIHLKIDSLKEETKIHSWIYKIAQNTIIDYYRKRKTVSINSKVNELYEELLEQTPAAEIAEGLKEMVEILPEKYSQALLLTEFQGMTQKEFAVKLGISISGAKSRVQRARQMLRDDLMRCCHYKFDRYGTIIDYHPRTCCCCN